MISSPPSREEFEMKTASFVVLLLVGLAIVASSMISAGVAYTRDWPVGPTTVHQIEAVAPGAGPALRGARGTAAAFGLAFGVLWLAVVFGPYRRGEAWAWWALLGATLALALVTVLRVPLAGARAGVSTAVTLLVLVLAGLALDLARLRRSGS
jgi:hypothetical protein